MLVAWLAWGLCGPSAARAQVDEFEKEPIRYSETNPDNIVSRLADRIAAKQTRLRHDGVNGYLADFLKSLDVPVSSQTLVFSKTSLQRHRISPATPRALYFNDEVYVGICQGERCWRSAWRTLGWEPFSTRSIKTPRRGDCPSGKPTIA